MDDVIESRMIITAAVTGSRATKEMNPAVPYTVREIIDSVVECHKAGAAISHIHMRHPETGRPDFHIGRFKEVLEGVRERCDVIVNLTTSGLQLDGADTFSRNLETVFLKPEMCSFECASMNLKDTAFVSSPRSAEAAARLIQEHGVKPEIELFDVGHARQALDLIRKGLIDDPPYFQLCMGVGWGIEATTENLLFMKRQLPRGALWSVLGVGKAQLPMITQAMLLGGHVRVGFEDNIYASKGVLAKSNAHLVEMAANLGVRLGRSVATAAEARRVLGIRNS